MQHQGSIRTTVHTIVALSFALFPLVAHGGLPSDAEPPRHESFRAADRVLDGAANWVSLGTDLAAFGAGVRVTVTGGPPRMPLRSQFSLEAPAVDGVLAGDKLYLVQREDADRLVVLDVNAPDAGVRPVRLEPAPRGALRIARMDDHLLVAEDGFGIRILLLPHPAHARHGRSSHGSHASPSLLGLVPIDGTISALASSMRTIYVAVDHRLIVVEAGIPALPAIAGEVPLGIRVDALAANGTTVYALSPDGLRIVKLGAASGPVTTEIHAGQRGTAIALAGRSLYVARGEAGLHEVIDRRAVNATFFVTVGDIFFDPAGTINVASGDTVRWDKPSTVFPHNVFSCNAGQVGCGGESATETFSSGPATTSPFSFSRMFTAQGPNRYLCQAHTASMQGNVMVTAAATAPPAVPDGRGGSAPMTVTKLDVAGSDLVIAFDTSCPNAAGHDIVFGTGAELPSTLGGLYAPSGGECAVGLVSPFTWTATPAPPVGELLWWVLVADDGADSEGSWGKNSAGGERTGPGTNGASGQCNNTDKTLANACGQ